jgi:diaminopimelate epimerase
MVGARPDADRVPLMSRMHLAKLHATGNDFLVRLALEPAAPKLTAAKVLALCDRHRGVGADGLITIGASVDGADCTMNLVNADGGAAEMSGNGIRCLAWVAARAGLGSRNTLVVDTDGGRRTVMLTRDGDGQVVAADCDMGPVSFGDADIMVTVDSTLYTGDVANVGNPHLVCFVDDPDLVPVTAHGPVIERDPRFPGRTNVEFVAVNASDALIMRVWERGAGETLSCGTGACASAAVAHRHGFVGESVRVSVRGGELSVQLGDTVRLGGPVAHVFDVEIGV